MIRIIIALCFLLFLTSISPIKGLVEIDVSWDFSNDRDFSGWANATAEEMHLDLKVENGEMSGTVLGQSFSQYDSPPHFDSPQLLIDLTRRHYLILRMMYFGSASLGRVLMKSSLSYNREHIDHIRQFWRDSIIAHSFSDSGSLSVNHSSNNVLDGNIYTSFTSTKPSAVYIIFDLGEPSWVGKLSILPSGDANSPKTCLLQSSETSTGVGPFKTLLTFTLKNNYSLNTNTFDNIDTAFQQVAGFEGHSRFWRLLILNNYGGPYVSIREITFHGYGDKVGIIPFALNNTGIYKNYYLPIFPVLKGSLARLRIEFLYDNNSYIKTVKTGKFYSEGLAVDYIRIARAPDIWRVRGCLDKYYESLDLANPVYNVTDEVTVINDQLPLRYFSKNYLSLQYATTYDCPLTGNVEITIDGINFGSKARVYIGGKDCKVLTFSRNDESGREESITCTLPPGSSTGLSTVRVENGILPGLFQEVSFLTYRMAPPVPQAPIATNVGARRVDLIWSPPGNVFDNMITTGYKILWFQPKFPSRISNLTVGNITTTSIRGLEPATEYVFAIAAIAEGAMSGSANLPTDLYGRRDLRSDYLIGGFSTITNITATLLYDFDFGFFNANKTINSSGTSSSESLGPTGMFGSEGHYGLVLVGDANIQNCNVSTTCCDGYNATIGLASCGTYPSVCAVLPERMLAYDSVIAGVTRRQVPSNLPYDNGKSPEINIITLEELISNKGANLPTASCGPAVRLTPSEGRRSGAAWYRRKVNVREGFDTTLTFEISNPSQRCDMLDDVNTYCRSRGADGFAFVIQNVSPLALGLAGSGLGYDGIFNSLAVEMDTYHNFDQMDFYENHIAVMTQGWRYNISANHSRSLATTTKIPDLTDGNHTVRIRYDPVFDEGAVPHPSFQVNGYTTWFIENADFENGGQGDWGTGFGLLYVYIDDLYSPVITTPLNLEATLNLDNGRAYVGITGATGDNHWQAHDILSWQFSSLYKDAPYTPPVIVNNEGAHTCVNESVCVHQPDYDHYMRVNNIWGKGHDSTEGWQTGTEGLY